MAGTGFTLKMKADGFDHVVTAMKFLGSSRKENILEEVGAIIETQIKHRIQDEKTAPDGSDWPEWSEEYAKTRSENDSLLMDNDDLRDSFESHATSKEVEVGTNLEYAATHQFGDKDRNIPARTFIGLSDENEDEIIETIEDLIVSNSGKLFK